MKTGMSLSACEDELNTVMILGEGKYEIAPAGHVVYSFPSSFEATMEMNNWKIRYRKYGVKALEVLFYAVRITVGLLIIFSFLLLFAALIIIAVALLTLVPLSPPTLPVVLESTRRPPP